MIPEPEDRDLLGVATSVADCAPLDWSALEASEMVVADPETFRELQLISRIAEVHRRVAREESAQSRTGTERHWGHLVIKEELGAGSFGVVYRAHDPRLDRDVALKLYKTTARLDSGLTSLFAEGRLLARVRHQNVVAVHGVEQRGDDIGLWLELVDGRTLADEVRGGGPLGFRETALIGQDVCRALAAVHQAGLIHRDVKAQNVMRERGGRIVLMDFGIGRELHAPATTGADRGGTPLYMAPELFEGVGASIASDIYSLGVLLFFLVTGSYPVLATTREELERFHREGRRQLVRDVRADLPDGFVDVIERACAREPSHRYATVGAMQAALTRAIGLPAEHTASSVRGTPSGRGLRWIAGFAGIVALVAIAVVASWWLRAPAAGDQPQAPLVAVREFRNLSQETGQDYFAAGMTEEIRGQLSKISALRLLSRAAVEKYGEHDVPRMAADLGVGSIVDGSVRLDRDRVRISVELVDARTEQTLWSEQYDREVADIFAVQSDVALQIARALQASMSPAERARVQKRSTENLEAYDLYLKASGMAVMGPQEVNLAGMELLQRALALDPRFPAAKAALAYRHVALSYGGDAQELDRAMTLSREAAEADPTLAAPHYVFGTAYTLKGQDAQARLAFMRALELAPNHRSAMANLSLNELQFGRLDDSLFWARRMFVVSGRTGDAFYHVGGALLSLRDDELTWRWLTYAERQVPSSPRVQELLAWAELLRGDDRASLTRLRRAAERWPTSEELVGVLAEFAFLLRADDADALTEKIASTTPDGISNLIADGVRVRRAHFLKRRGDRRAEAEADEVLRLGRQQLAGGSENPWTSINMAAAFMIRGDREAAFEFLTRAVTSGYRDYPFLVRDPIFEPIASDPRFRALVDRITADVTLQRGRAADRGLLDLGSLVPGLK